MAKPTGYELSRMWFDWCFVNTEKVKPIHTALYFFAIEHCNRLGWKEKFGLPTEMTKDAIGVKSWHTYIAAFNNLVEWGFFELIERSKNQYSSNIIALTYFDEAHDEAHDKATKCIVKKHQSTRQSTCQSIDSINKLITKETIKQEGEEILPTPLSENLDLKPVKVKNTNPAVFSLPFTSEKFKMLWGELVLTNKWKNKPSSAIQMSLIKLGRYEEAYAIILIENAISGNYQGVVFSDTDQNYAKWKARPKNLSIDPSGNSRAIHNIEVYSGAMEQIKRKYEHVSETE